MARIAAHLRDADIIVVKVGTWFIHSHSHSHGIGQPRHHHTHNHRRRSYRGNYDHHRLPGQTARPLS
jgi:hypothetical protein